MPVYKNEKNNTWYCSFYYTDWKGERKKKKKMGFKTKREAKEYENEYSVIHASDPEMTFDSLVELYFTDLKDRIRESTMGTKHNMIDNHITPVIGKIKLCDITPATIRHWQNEMLRKEKNGKRYTPTFLRSVNSQMTAIFNYAVKYHGLSSNPCLALDPIGKKKADEMKFWTLDEFNKAIAYEKSSAYHLCFMLLFWGGFRVGEVLALTPADLIDDKKAVSITKTFHRVDGEDKVGPPKSTNSERVVELPDFVYEELKDYSSSLYGIDTDDRIFYFQRGAVNKELDKITVDSGVKRIRVHDLRHSHVSHLIELGFQTHAIAARIGDSPETVNRTYTHLYPNTGQRIAATLNESMKKSTLGE